jgi:nucleoside-diphosphate-sugar epimerase
MHTILGINGNIGKLLAHELVNKGFKVRGISRKILTDSIWENVAADVLDSESLKNAVEGSEVVYLLVGLEYNIKVWERDWVLLMQNTIDACVASNAKLVFVDNVYMYGRVVGAMTEQTPINPCSEKGRVRAEVAQLFADAFDRKILRGCIARAADFYGPDCSTSMITQTVFMNMAKAKTAQWMGNPDVKHSFTYTLDIAKALLIMGIDARADNQVWHLPTAKNALTGREIVQKTAFLTGKKPKLMALGGFMLSVLGLFIPILKEMKEMMYQYNFDYEFNSDKFEKTFNFKPTSYEEGLKTCVDFYFKLSS